MDLLADTHNRINGVAVGQKHGGPICEGEWCVTAFVSEKLTVPQLEQHEIRPFHQAVADALRHTDLPLDEVVTDVVVAGPFQLLPTPQRGKYGGNPPALNAQRPFRSLRCGIGLTNPETTGYPHGLSVGTAGFYMTDGEHLYVVSNNHVIAGSNTGKAGQAIVQPGTLDLTSIELMMMPNVAALAPVKVANLVDFVPIDIAPSPPTPTPPPSSPNGVDAAIARLDIPAWRNVADVDRLTFGGRIMGVANPYQVDRDGNLTTSPRVYKVGRTTGYTEGLVTNIAARVPVRYPGGYATFVDQIAVQQTHDNVGPFSDGGDSGSGVLNDTHELVGLLFAGDPTRTLVNPIALVVDALRSQTGLNLRAVHA